MMELDNFVFTLTVWILPALLAITLHEAAHGYAALRFGDKTALMMGRVSLNPLRHIDPFGTVLLPLLLLMTTGMMFGWAKPVPVNFANLRNPRWDSVVVAAAGPTANLALLFLSLGLAWLLPLVPSFMENWLAANLMNSVIINLVLFVFNLFPIPPLDGGRIAVGVLPRELAYPLARLEPYGMFIVIFLLFILPWLGNQIGMNLDLFGWAFRTAAGFLVG